MSIEYKTACQAWGADLDVVILLDQSGEVIAQIPFQFLERCNAARNVTYLRNVVRELLCLPKTADVFLLHGSEQLDCVSEATVKSGSYTYLPATSSSPVLLRGPQGKSLSRPFRDTDGTSTVSRSSRSSVNQNKFRERLFLRDGQCLVSGTDDEDNLVAAHIIPFSLGQEFLDSLTSYARQVTLFAVNNGLLLRPDIHQAFDRFRWGIYVDSSGRHYIHVFGEDYRDLHGSEIQYRTRNRSKLPNVSLLRWQYQQCLMARFRGFHVL